MRISFVALMDVKAHTLYIYLKFPPINHWDPGNQSHVFMKSDKIHYYNCVIIHIINHDVTGCLDTDNNFVWVFQTHTVLVVWILNMNMFFSSLTNMKICPGFIMKVTILMEVIEDYTSSWIVSSYIFIISSQSYHWCWCCLPASGGCTNWSQSLILQTINHFM